MFFYHDSSKRKEPKFKVGSKVQRSVCGRGGNKTYDLTVISVETSKGKARDLWTEDIVTAYRHTYKCGDESGAVFTVREGSLQSFVSTKIVKTRYFVMDSFTGKITKQHIVIDSTTRRFFKTTAEYIGHVLGVDPALIEVK